MRTVLVTGSSRGIGRAIAVRLAGPETNVVVNYRSDADAAAEVVDEITGRGGKAVAVGGDVADPEQLLALFDQAERLFGGLDVVVGNVGTARFGPIAEATDDDFDLMFATNARATFQLLRAAANRINDGGRIVVISGGVTATTQPGTGVYAASKAVGNELVRILAHELGPRSVTVNAVRPGPVRTEALLRNRGPEVLQRLAETTPLRRIGEPDDIASVVAFLASPDAGWLTGQLVNAGGGLF
nr:SDR family oxidoreductase [Kibdelosporangium sp. MJ126-NF4]CEL22896.1 3-oxoacyl-[acyl-carrier protein] reductase [Kibdelosporangium sp. MJ126-NF4]CTQ90036.1 3-oxoacyl-[acyl-carrier protein] reductase (EC 1.1.1.100) [Kibdelosporangium sp. MJ126-NF4]